jgi:hypothetical protein
VKDLGEQQQHQEGNSFRIVMKEQNRKRLAPGKQSKKEPVGLGLAYYSQWAKSDL